MMPEHTQHAESVAPRFVKNSATGKMHYAPDGERLACGRTLLSFSSSPTVYGIHTWCEKCHAARYDGDDRG